MKTSIDYRQKFPGLPPDILEIADELQALILRLFPDAVVTSDGENAGYGFGTGYKDLVFVISPFRKHVNLGIAHGATLMDPAGLLEGPGKVHRHIKVRHGDQVNSPDLEKLLLAALRRAHE